MRQAMRQQTNSDRFLDFAADVRQEWTDPRCVDCPPVQPEPELELAEGDVN